MARSFHAYCPGGCGGMQRGGGGGGAASCVRTKIPHPTLYSKWLEALPFFCKQMNGDIETFKSTGDQTIL